MAELILRNQATFEGVYNDNPVEFESNAVEVTIINGIEALKSANKSFWINGPLQYTIVVTNNSGAVFFGGTMQDTLDPSLVTFDYDYGVFINDEPTPYSYSQGLLTVSIPTIEDGESITITFQVLQA